MKEIWVYCREEDGVLKFDPGLVSKASELAATIGGKVATVLCSEKDLSTCEPFEAGADMVYLIVTSGGEEAEARVLTELAAKISPEIFLFSATVEDSAIAARTAAFLKTGLTADCTGLYIDENGYLRQVRPAYGGGVEAEIVCPLARPQMATVRKGAFQTAKSGQSRRGTVITYTPDTIPEDPVEILERVKTPVSGHLCEARVIVAGGLGVGSKEGFMLLDELARKLHGMVGATRAAVDAGYASYDRQIGQTGMSVCPEIYLVFGVSGAVQHIAGMHASGTVIAVNRDPKAKIFDYADLAIMGDWHETAEMLLKRL
ncbi:MAG: electron transfer flavoprotein subunit alpha/FixB family protein [Negativicutes bacterium]